MEMSPVESNATNRVMNYEGYIDPAIGMEKLLEMLNADNVKDRRVKIAAVGGFGDTMSLPYQAPAKKRKKVVEDEYTPSTVDVKLPKNRLRYMYEKPAMFVREEDGTYTIRLVMETITGYNIKTNPQYYQTLEEGIAKVEETLPAGAYVIGAFPMYGQNYVRWAAAPLYTFSDEKTAADWFWEENKFYWDFCKNYKPNRD